MFTVLPQIVLSGVASVSRCNIGPTLPQGVISSHSHTEETGKIAQEDNTIYTLSQERVYLEITSGGLVVDLKLKTYLIESKFCQRF